MREADGDEEGMGNPSTDGAPFYLPPACSPICFSSTSSELASNSILKQTGTNEHRYILATL